MTILILHSYRYRISPHIPNGKGAAIEFLLVVREGNKEPTPRTCGSLRTYPAPTRFCEVSSHRSGGEVSLHDSDGKLILHRLPHDQLTPHSNKVSLRLKLTSHPSGEHLPLPVGARNRSLHGEPPSLLQYRYSDRSRQGLYWRYRLVICTLL